jgi:hypothetical protein
VIVWLAVGFLGLVVGLVWLRAVGRSRRTSEVRAELTVVRAKPSAMADRGEPDAIAG